MLLFDVVSARESGEFFRKKSYIACERLKAFALLSYGHMTQYVSLTLKLNTGVLPIHITEDCRFESLALAADYFLYSKTSL